MGTRSKFIAKAASWTGLMASVLTLVLGIIHVAALAPRIRWSSSFLGDSNGLSWRAKGFSLSPTVLVDAWTPFVFGAVGILLHFSKCKIEFITKDYLRFFIFHLLMGLIATIGYCGNLGILFSIVVWVCCLLSLLATLVSGDEKADLELSIPYNVKYTT